LATLLKGTFGWGHGLSACLANKEGPEFKLQDLQEIICVYVYADVLVYFGVVIRTKQLSLHLLADGSFCDYLFFFFFFFGGTTI
jgi:hypothetical protein